MRTPFDYSSAAILNVEAALSTDRFTRYLGAVGGDRKRALTLYEWNAKASAAFYVPLQICEVAFRNACHRELTAQFGPLWHDDPHFLSLYWWLPKEITKTKDDLFRKGLAQDTPHIVAALSFGFWTGLFASRYEHTLWNRGLNKTFGRHGPLVGTAPTRPLIAKRLDYLREFRNRIAHHEPIYHRALFADHASIIELTDWISDDVGPWAETVSTCDAILRAKPLLGSPPSPKAGWCGTTVP